LHLWADFLAYHDGVYFPTQSAFKFNGQNIVKIIGWGKDVSGDYWIVQAAWGDDWGQGGYASVLSGRQEIGIDGIAIAPMTTL
jgi:hypothetical protein